MSYEANRGKSGWRTIAIRTLIFALALELGAVTLLTTLEYPPLIRLAPSGGEVNAASETAKEKPTVGIPGTTGEERNSDGSSPYPLGDEASITPATVSPAEVEKHETSPAKITVADDEGADASQLTENPEAGPPHSDDPGPLATTNPPSHGAESASPAITQSVAQTDLLANPLSLNIEAVTDEIARLALKADFDSLLETGMSVSQAMWYIDERAEGGKYGDLKNP